MRKAKKINEDALVYNKDARGLEKETWCRKMKWTLILTVLIIGLILVIVLPLVLSKKSDKNSTTTPGK